MDGGSVTECNNAGKKKTSIAVGKQGHGNTGRRPQGGVRGNRKGERGGERGKGRCFIRSDKVRVRKWFH